MIHGGGTMVMLLLLGAMFPVHIQRTWRSGKNRANWDLLRPLATFNVLLIVTAFGLDDAGSDTLRSWISDLHIAAGLFLPLLNSRSMSWWAGEVAGI